MKKLIFIGIALLIASTGFSQKIKLISGKTNLLKGQDIFEVQFTYDNMRVGKLTEEQYVAQKREEANKKDNDNGDRWHNLWIKDRETKFETKFMSLFNKYGKKAGLSIDYHRPESKIIMVVDTYFTEPGYNIGITSSPAYVSMKISFYERLDPDKPFAVFDLFKAKGSEHFDAGSRIAEAYALAGKNFVKVLSKHVK